MPTNASYCIKIINRLYQEVDGFNLSLNARQNEGHTNDSSLLYGELTDHTLIELLEIIDPQPGEVFYDFGSGVGKPVLWASVLYDWQKCCGIELLKSLYELSLQQKDKLIHHPEIRKLLLNKQFNIQFFNDDFLSFDFSDATVILLNATAFIPAMWTKLSEKFLTLAPGTRIIVLTKKIDLPEFEHIHTDSYLMSWGMNSVNIYRKRL